MAVSLIALHWKRQGGKLKISIQKTNVREIVNCLHILGNEPYFQLLLFIISDLRKCPCPIRASRENEKCPIRATFCPIRASRFGVNRPNFAKRNNTSRGEVRKNGRQAEKSRGSYMIIIYKMWEQWYTAVGIFFEARQATRWVSPRTTKDI